MSEEVSVVRRRDGAKSNGVVKGNRRPYSLSTDTLVDFLSLSDTAHHLNSIPEGADVGGAEQTNSADDDDNSVVVKVPRRFTKKPPPPLSLENQSEKNNNSEPKVRNQPKRWHTIANKSDLPDRQAWSFPAGFVRVLHGNICPKNEDQYTLGNTGYIEADTVSCSPPATPFQDSEDFGQVLANYNRRRKNKRKRLTSFRRSRTLQQLEDVRWNLVAVTFIVLALIGLIVVISLYFKFS